MNKFFTKVASLCVGLALAAGVGIAVSSSKAERVRAAEDDTHEISDFTGKGVGTLLNNGGTPDEITVSDQEYTVKQVIIGWKHNKSNDGITASVSVGGESLGSGKVGGQNTTTTTTIGDGSSSLSGDVTISWSNSMSGTGKGTLYINTLTLVEGAGSGPVVTYTISYNSNGGTGTMSDTTGSNPAVASCSFNAPSSDMEFKEWNTDSTGTGTKYEVGAKPGKDLTLYAIWQEKTAEKGTEDNPYTVLEARAAIDAGSGTSGVYATGIVSKIVTAYSSQYKNVSFNMSVDGTEAAVQLQAYREKSNYSSTVKVGDTVVVYGSLTKYGSTYEFGANCAITTLTEPTGTKYSVIDRIDNGTLSETEVIEGTNLSVHVVPEYGYFYPESLTFVRVAGVDVAYSYVNGVVTVENVQGNVTIEGACTASTRIKSIYGQLDGSSIQEFYGTYVGFLEGSGPMIMDGVDGIMLYNTSEDVSSWTEGQTILHVTQGSVSIYNGLYEVKSYSVSVAESADVSAPVTHITTGSETALEANRLTNATGFVSGNPTKGSFDSDPHTGDIQFPFTVGSHTFSVFYKSAGQTQEVLDVLNDSLANQTQITVKGFTGWYNAFQLTMNGIIESSESYTAEIFAQDLLDQTDAVCVNYVDGESSYAQFKEAFENIWSDLNSADKYPTLPSDQKEILANADRDDSGTVVERAMFRYDFLTGKYQLSEFIAGRNPIIPSGSIVFEPYTVETSSSVVIIIVVTVASITLLGTTLVIRKRKHQ